MYNPYYNNIVFIMNSKKFSGKDRQIWSEALYNNEELPWINKFTKKYSLNKRDLLQIQYFNTNVQTSNIPPESFIPNLFNINIEEIKKPKVAHSTAPAKPAAPPAEAPAAPPAAPPAEAGSPDEIDEKCKKYNRLRALGMTNGQLLLKMKSENNDCINQILTEDEIKEAEAPAPAPAPPAEAGAPAPPAEAGAPAPHAQVVVRGRTGRKKNPTDSHLTPRDLEATIKRLKKTPTEAPVLPTKKTMTMTPGQSRMIQEAQDREDEPGTDPDAWDNKYMKQKYLKYKKKYMKLRKKLGL